jgi:hypothetical protein
MPANNQKTMGKGRSRWDQVNWGLLGLSFGVVAFWIILIKMIASALSGN